MSGVVIVFRNRSGTALKLFTYDGGAYWLCLRRLSRGTIRWWPNTDKPIHSIQAQELAVLLYNGLPDRADPMPSKNERQGWSANIFFFHEGSLQGHVRR